jgi:membrane-associated phospholipid phosphatase
MKPQPVRTKSSLKPFYAGIVFLALYALTALLVRTGLTQGFDNQVAIAVNVSLGPVISKIMYLASIYGREGVWIPVVILMLGLGKPNTKMFAIELALLFIVGIIAGTLAKDVWFRSRPFIQLTAIILRVPKETDSSFPSGHAVIVSLGASLLLRKYRKSSRKARVASFLLAFEAAIVCYSRIYNGAHFPTDVIAGIFLGSAVTFIGGFLLERYLLSYLKKLGTIAERVTKILHLPQFL